MESCFSNHFSFGMFLKPNSHNIYICMSCVTSVPAVVWIWDLLLFISHTIVSDEFSVSVTTLSPGIDIGLDANK